MKTNDNFKHGQSEIMKFSKDTSLKAESEKIEYKKMNIWR